METQEAEEGPTYQPLRGPGGAAGCLPDTKTVARMMATLEQSGKAKRLMIGNLWLSVIYNFIAVPIAIAGLASPLIAAAAMSGSSVLVTLNALRARRARGVSP